MRWSWKIGRVAGIGVYVHVTFVLLLAWVGLEAFSDRGHWGDVFEGLGFILMLFGIVVLHELGHALTARRFGIGTRDITLLPIGGVARLERLPEAPVQELLVALAGPAVNVALALILYVLLRGARQLAAPAQALAMGGHFLAALMWVNVGLALFNLLPAFPLDGGRVLRALLATRLNYVRATTIAARIGQSMAVLLGLAGLGSILGVLGPFSNPFLLLIGLFIWAAARQEAGLVRLKSALGGITATQLMITDVQALSPREPLRQAAQRLLGGWQREFPVVEDGCLAGLLTRRALIDGLAQGGQESSVGQAMERQFPSVSPEEPLERVLLQLWAAPARDLIVARDGRLFGILAGQTISDYLLIQAALHGAPEAREWGLRLAQRPAA